MSEQRPDDPRLNELAKEIQRLDLRTAELWKEAQRVARSGSQPVSDQTKSKSRARLRARLRQEPAKKGQTASR